MGEITVKDLFGRIDELEQQLDAVTAERDALRSALESLTPNGSEFHNSAQACVEFIRSRLSSAGKLAKERNALRDSQTLHLAREKRIINWIAAVADGKMSRDEFFLEVAQEFDEIPF